ncbi:MAG: DeoR family transcriptional regulator [Prevotellaceae bacterium]|jgi:predicted HTH transcriptional regulator|nr:DeoR family transcriptional regulator [Prevotellaceae bacterium]
MLRLCKNAGLREPEFIQEEMFRTVLWREQSTDFEMKGPDKSQDNLTANQQKILAEITQNISITIPQLAEIIKISERKIRENIHKLKEKGILERHGAKRNGYWKISTQK